MKSYLYLTYVLDQLRRMDPFPKPEDLDRLLPSTQMAPHPALPLPSRTLLLSYSPAGRTNIS
nr:hypothetical protein [Enterocloster clostridioformis]